MTLDTWLILAMHNGEILAPFPPELGSSRKGSRCSIEVDIHPMGSTSIMNHIYAF